MRDELRREEDLAVACNAETGSRSPPNQARYIYLIGLHISISASIWIRIDPDMDGYISMPAYHSADIDTEIHLHATLQDLRRRPPKDVWGAPPDLSSQNLELRQQARRIDDAEGACTRAPDHRGIHMYMHIPTYMCV